MLNYVVKRVEVRCVRSERHWLIVFTNGATLERVGVYSKLPLYARKYLEEHRATKWGGRGIKEGDCFHVIYD